MRTETTLREALAGLADQAPAGDAILHDLASTRRRRTQRRRGLVLALAGGVAVLVAVLVISLPMLLSRRSAEPADPPRPAVPMDQRLPGNWTMISTVVPPAGWRMEQREIYLDAEQSVLVPTRGTTDASCSVALRSVGVDPRSSKVRPASMGGRAGFYLSPSSEDSATFYWTYASGGWAEASCSGMRDPKPVIARIVPGVRLAGQQVKIPFSLQKLPTGLYVKAVYQGGERPESTRSIDVSTDEDSKSPGHVNVYVNDKMPFVVGSDADQQRLTINGRDAVWSPADEALCFIGRPAICIADSTGELERDPSGSVPAAMRALAEAIEPAADLNDPATWPTASDAIPR